MVERCTCGAHPPDDARFCHKCGRPLYDYVLAEAEETPPPLPAIEVAAPAASTETVSFRNRNAIRVGVITALLTILLNVIPVPPPLATLRLPPISFAAGWFAVWYWRRRTRQQPSVREGARLGWMAGLFTFLIFAAVFTFVLVCATIPGVLDQLRQQLPKNADAQKLIDFLSNPSFVELFSDLLAMFLMFTALPTIAGAISARFGWRETR